MFKPSAGNVCPIGIINYFIVVL